MYNGLLPQHYFSDLIDDDLAAYIGLYLNEEIKAEGLSRNIPGFARFLEVAATCNTQMLNFTSVASDAQIDANLTVAGDAELNNLSVTGDTTVANLTVNGKIITAGATPTVVLGANTVVGQNGTVSIEGNDTAGTITYTSGTKNMPTYDLSSGAQATVTFSSAYGAVPRIALTAKNQGSASVKYYVDTTTNGFVVHFLDAPTASTTFTFDYLIIQ